MNTYKDFINSNIAPYSAKKIGVYDESGNRVGYVPIDDFKPSYGKKLYSFGFLSDVHQKPSDQTDLNTDDLVNALTFFKNIENAEFVCVSGDIGYSNLTTELQLFQDNVNTADIDIPVYATTGNHDCPSTSDVDITSFYSYMGLSDIAPSDGATYSYEVTKTHTTSGGTTVTDHFLFLAIKRHKFSLTTYLNNDINWLRKKLNEYENDRCFVITHLFIPYYAGNFRSRYNKSAWLTGDLLSNIKDIVDSHPRSIWFSGHSHWKWYLQKYHKKANIYPLSNIGRTTAWTVHIPGCAYPRDVETETYGTNGEINNRNTIDRKEQSEGAVIDVYEDYIDIRGIEFKGPDDSTYVNRYLPIADYRLYTEPDLTSSKPDNSIFRASINNWVINTSKGNSGDTLTDDITITDDGTDVYTKIKFDAVSEGFHFTAENMDPGDMMTIYYDDVVIECPEGNVIDAPIAFGFYDDIMYTDVNHSYGYYLETPLKTIATRFHGSNGYFGVQLNTSSKVLTSNSDLQMSSDTPLYITFKNLSYSIEDYTGDTDLNNEKIN